MKFAPAILGVCASALTLDVGCSDTADSSNGRFDDLVRMVEQERAELGAPGVAIAIVEHGEVTFARGFGKKDLRRPDAVQPTTLFRIGSATKPLTAVAVLQTVDEGLVDLNQPVTAYVPEFHLNLTPDLVPDLTVQQLLTQTSGLADIAGELDAPADERTDAALNTYLTGRFADIDYIGAPPGAVWAYANANFMLAGLVAERVTGTPYRNLMQQRVFHSLGMERTVFLPERVLDDGDFAVGENCQNPNEPRCMWPDVQEVIEPDSYDNPWSRPAGYAWSSVLDMAEFAKFVLRGDTSALSETQRAAMTTAQVSTHEYDDLLGYGYGMFVPSGFSGFEGYHAVGAIEHGGDIPGFSSTFWCLSAQDFCFTALSNADGAHFDKSLATAIETLTDLPAPTAAPDLAPKPERYPAYAGTYDEATVGQIVVTAEGDALTIQVPALDADGVSYEPELVPTLVDNFVVTVDGVPLPMTFIADQGGNYQYLRSRPYLATRSAP